MRQTLAIFLDAYRELNSKRMFWITMILSGIVVLVFAAIGNNEKGITFFAWTIPFAPMSTNVIPREDFYKITFVTMGIQMWLAWVAAILALISTASIIPDFLAGGAIELSLSKPFGRVRLFLTKYAAALLFVALQVLVFTTACFIVIGIRGGAWEPGLFLAVPLVTLVFSFLFSVCVLVGMITRSTIAALLVTILVWCGAFVINTGEAVMLGEKIESKVRLEKRLSTIESLKHSITEAGDGVPEDEIEPKKTRLTALESKIEDNRSNAKLLARIHAPLFATKTLLPKTQESVSLMTRWLISEANLEKFGSASTEHAEEQDSKRRGKMNMQPRDPLEASIEKESQKQMRDALNDRGALWTLGTSALFEAIMLGIAAWLFARRDF